MKKFLLLALTGISAIGLSAQSVFQKAIDFPFSNGSMPKKIIQCSDNGYLIATTGTYGGIYIVKTDASGTPQWAKVSTANATYNTLADIGESSSGGYYFLSEGYDSVYTAMSFYLTMIDANGNFQWSRTYATGSYSYGSSKVKQMPDGGFMISESLYSKMGMLRTDAAGNVTWHHSFTADTSAWGKNPSFDCIINNDGSTITTGKRENDICLVKCDGNGNPLWIKTMTNGVSYYHANSIAATPDGNYVIGGYEDYSAFLMKIDPSGNMLWYKTYVDANGSLASIETVKVDPNGNIVMTAGSGFYAGDIIIADPAGNVISAFSYGDGMYTTIDNVSLCLTNDWGMAITGYYTDYYSGVSALSFFKLDANMQPGCEMQQLNVSASSSASGSPAQISVPFFTINESSNSSSCASTFNNAMTYETDFCLLFSVNEQSASMTSIKAYPSPVASSDVLHIAIDGVNGEAIINIFDATGKLVRTTTSELHNSSDITFDMNGMNAGIYFARVTDTNGNLVGDTRFVVQ